MKNKYQLIKGTVILMLMLMLLTVSPQHSRCSEPELSSEIELHSLTSPHQNDI